MRVSVIFATLSKSLLSPRFRLPSLKIEGSATKSGEEVQV